MGKNSVADGISLVFLSDLDCVAGVHCTDRRRIG